MQATLSKNKTMQSSAKRQKVVQSTMLHSYPAYKAVDYQAAIMLQLEVMLQRFEPISRLHDCAVKNSLVQIYGRGILKHIPETIDTIFNFNNYIVAIDLKTRKALMEQIQKTAGTMAMEVDGVTVNKTSLLLYTLSKGDFSVFTDITRLRELVHVRAAEVEDGVQKMDRIQDFDHKHGRRQCCHKSYGRSYRRVCKEKPKGAASHVHPRPKSLP